MQEQITKFLNHAEVEKSVCHNNLMKFKAIIAAVKRLRKLKSKEEINTYCTQIEEKLREIKRENLKIEWEEDELLRKLYEIKKASKQLE